MSAFALIRTRALFTIGDGGGRECYSHDRLEIEGRSARLQRLPHIAHFDMRPVASSLLLVCLLLIPQAGCDSFSSPSRHIATEWHRKDLQLLLSRWLEVAPTPSGLLKGNFDRQWKPKPARGGDLVTHSRLVYSMAVGYEVTQDGRYLEAATRGGDFLVKHFHDAVHGGFFSHVDEEGKVVQANKSAYSHAFALFALAHLTRITKEERYRSAALSAWREININLRDREGGFRHSAPRDFAPTKSLRSQNPVMHMFEALLALIDATEDAEAKEAAKSVGDFVLYKLLQGQLDGGAYIPEWYDERWKPLESKEKGGYIDIGHQFEWIHLLMTATRKGLSPIYGTTAERLLAYALKHGFDEADGGVFNRFFPDGTLDRDKFFWQQAEGARALMVAASASKRSDLWRRYEQVRELIASELIDAHNGGWKPAARRTCEKGRCGDGQPDPYHMIGMHITALELSRP